MRININPDRDIDYTILNGRMSKADKQNIELIDNKLLLRCVENNLLTEQELKDILYLVKRKNKYEEVVKVRPRTKTGAFKNDLSKIYELGLTYQTGYTLVEMDLITSLIQIIQVISNLNKIEDESLVQDISNLRHELGDLFTGEIDNDEGISKAMEDIVGLDNSFLLSYISKAIELSKGKSREIRTVDMFNVERKYRKLYPLESITIPISYSLNTLQYVIIEELRNNFRRGEKRFAAIDKTKIYYFVRNDVIDKFTSAEFYVDGVKLDIKFYIKKIPHFNWRGGFIISKWLIVFISIEGNKHTGTEVKDKLFETKSEALEYLVEKGYTKKTSDKLGNRRYVLEDITATIHEIYVSKYYL